VAQFFLKKDRNRNTIFACIMYVRRKKNRSGSTSVVVVSKQSGRYKEVHVVGTSSDTATIDSFYQQGLSWVNQRTGLPDIFDQYEKEKFDRDNAEYFLGNIENVLLNGTAHVPFDSGLF
jgi:hypothetical protein